MLGLISHDHLEVNIMAVLLIGSTGSGKSTLGNFLLDLSNPAEAFAVATDNLSKTTHTEIKSATVTFFEKNQRSHQKDSDKQKDGGDSQQKDGNGQQEDGASQKKDDDSQQEDGDNHQQKDGNGQQDGDSQQEDGVGQQDRDNQQEDGDGQRDGDSQQEDRDSQQEDSDSQQKDGDYSQQEDEQEDGDSQQEDGDSQQEDGGSDSQQEDDYTHVDNPEDNPRIKIPKIKQFSQMLKQYVISGKCKKERLTIIDTPGLNEGPKEDIKHMINIVEKLQQQEKIQAVIFVVKFNAKIDQQYRDTIKYFSQLRPSLFSNNSIIIMTDYLTDQYSILRRQHQKMDGEKIISNVKEEIKKCCGIWYDPIVLALDCLPLPHDHEEVAKSKQMRNVILSLIFSQRSVSTKDIQIAKTKSILDEDAKFIRQYQGEIEGYNARLKQVNKELEAVLTEVQEKRTIISSIDRKLDNYEKRLKEKDSDDLITARVWSIDSTWKWFRRIKSNFEINSEWDIVHVEQWDNGHCTWKNIVKEDKKVSGVARGHFMRRLYARVTLVTTKKLKYADDIKKIKQSSELKREKQAKAEKELQEKCDASKDMEDTIKDLTAFIKDREKLMSQYSNEVMTLEEAHEKMKQLYPQ